MEEGVARLKRHFGHQYAEDVLASVIEVCGGDVNAAIEYLTAGEGHIAANDPQQEDGIPSDYMPQQAVAIPSKEEELESMHEAVLKIKRLFQSESSGSKLAADSQNKGTLHTHSQFFKNSFGLYATTLLKLLSVGVEISKSSRARVLACCWHYHHYKFADYLLRRYESLFQINEVLKALQLLDAGRRIRALEKKLARLEAQGCKKKKKKGQLKTYIADLSKEVQLGGGTVSGALCKRVRAWVRSIPASKLEFYALAMPTNPWKELADIIHLKPSDFALEWFLPFVFGKDPGPGTIVSVKNQLKPDGSNLVEILQRYEAKLPYTYLRQAVSNFPDEAKAIVAKYTPLDTLIWYHEELGTPEVNKIIKERLAEGKEEIRFGYGKIMERLLYFRRTGATEFFESLLAIASKQLSSYKLDLDQPVVVLGDASYSMDVAIRTATIIASVVTLLADAELKFFHEQVIDCPKPIKNISDVIDVAEQVKADKMTAPACALWQYWEEKKVVKCFIVVTDEVENVRSNGEYFHTLFSRYAQRVYPAKLVFVSFLENPGTKKGRMVTALERMGFDVLQFRLDGKRPDLTKLEDILGLLASDSANFAKTIVDVSYEYFSETEGLEASKNDKGINVEANEKGLFKLIKEWDSRYKEFYGDETHAP